MDIMKKDFAELSYDEMSEINGGFVLVTPIIAVGGVTLITAGFAAGSWLKHKIWG